MIKTLKILFLKVKDLEFSKKIEIFFNFFAIIIMLFTILDGQKGTDKTIKALKDEVTRQIASYQRSSSEQIAAIKETTTDEINEIKEIERCKKLISLLALRKEIELNLRKIRIRKKNFKDSINGKILSVDFFNVSAFSQGMVTNFIADEALINEIFLLYNSFCIANTFTKMAIDTNVLPISNKSKTITKYSKEVINRCNENEIKCVEILEKLNMIEKNLR